MTNSALRGKPDAGNPHVRFDGGEVASAATPRRGSLLYNKITYRMNAIIFALVALLSFGAAADVVTNSWQGADGGAWGTSANWSAGHVPDGTEYVVFPDKGASYSVNVDGDYQVGCFYVDYRNSGGTVDFTLTGSGRITGTGTDTHYVRTNRRLVLESGVTLDLTTAGGNKYLLLYNGLVVKAGATNLVDMLSLHWNGSYVDLQGGYMNVSGNTSYRESHKIQIEDGGRYSSAKIVPSTDSAYTHALTFIMNGGFATPKTVTLTAESTLTMNGGLLEFREQPSIDAATTLNFNGGTNQFAATVTDGALARRFLCGNENTAINVTASSDKSLLLDESCTITAPLKVTGGIYFTNTVTVASVRPVFANTIYNAATSGGNTPTLRFPAIVFNAGAPFTTLGNTRNFYVEGPMTFRAIGDQVARAGTTPYPFVTGDIVIDTRDWYNESVTHTMTMELGPRDDAALTVRGGGTVRMVQQYSAPTSHVYYRSVVVEDGTTLTLIIGGTTDGRLRTDRFVLGPNTTLNLDMSKASGTPEYNAVIAGKFEIDPTARINVTVPADFTSGAIPIFIDEGSDSLADYSSQINYSGNTTGVSFVRSGGSLMAVKKTVTEADGTYQYEWTGGGNSADWTEAANWYGNEAPPEKKTIAFGAADGKTNSNFDMFTPSGSTAGTLLFRDTAVSSFHISSGTMTFTNVNASVQSYSALPQFLGSKARSTDNIAFATYDVGPIVLSGGFESKSANKVMYAKGDIRCHLSGKSAAASRWPILQLQAAAEGRHWTRLSVMDGAMAFTNQTTAFSVPQAGFRVAKGATLTFQTGTASAMYQWTATPQRIVVDGTLDVQAPFVGGGARQLYGGEGVIRIASLRPSTGATSVEFGDTLSIEAPASWPTVAATGADAPLRLAARSGRPVIHAASGWTYGPVSGTSTTTEPADRAAYIYAGATLAVEPGGGVATFADPVEGPGTLEITNGTLKIEGGISPETKIAVAANGAFVWNSSASLAGLSIAEGGALVFSNPAVLTVADDVSLSGVALRVPGGSMSGMEGWTRLLVAKSISGTPQHPKSNWEFRIKALDNGMDALEVREHSGMIIVVR